MKHILTTIFSLFILIAFSQETVYPAKEQKETIALTNATIHIGNGQVIENGMIIFSKGKIVDVRPTANIADIKIIDCKGSHIYPGLITSQTDLGLNEISAVRAVLDKRELGEINANVRSIVAYNTDSKIIGTLRSNGILLANIVPQGGILSGSSSVVQLDAWNWEDALYKADAGIHFRMPNLVARRMWFRQATQTNPMQAALDRIEKLRQFFYDAKAYYAIEKPEHTNIKFEAVRGLFTEIDAYPYLNWKGVKKQLRPQQNFYIHAETVKEIQIGVAFAKEFQFKPVIVGGADSWMITNYLKDNDVAVILNQMHSLPITQDDDIDQPYKTPYLLQQAGVLFAIGDVDENSRGRNLLFNAGTAVTYGLTKEQALQAITFSAAKILGIDAQTGTLEKGKDANIVVSTGDILDMKSSNVIHAFIQGREVSLDNKQKQLYERYKYKYGIK
ncbi:MAG: amidohydrolase family protein [Chitinophagaceae bacterium]|nr:amidohydrolase family protein [Chitinophagaceae bacterium]MCW5906077.1 amidohydrolase family protein [Chitinophagaceae bacterium]